MAETPRILPAPSGSDDTATIQAALDTLRPGQWLVGQPGATYLHNKSLQITVPGSGIAGTRLHATNPDDQAILLRAHGVTVRDNELTAVTDRRRQSPWQARIAAWGMDDGAMRLTDISIIGNTVRHDGALGSPTQNGASAGGIFLYNVAGFLVQANTVRRTCADGIHVTAGSCNGRILGNTVEETGDDGIACVSYMGDGPVGKDAAAVRSFRMTSLCADVLVEGNTVRGQYWGRGLTVIGGRGVTIRRNSVSRIYGSAGIMLARERPYNTWDVTGILVEDNDVSDIQTDTKPLFCPTGAGFADRLASMSNPKSGHGAVELHATADAAQVAISPDLYRVGWITIKGNRIGRAPRSVRVGAYSPAGSMRLIGIVGNTLDSIDVWDGSPFQGSVTHFGNKRADGTAITSVPNAYLNNREPSTGCAIFFD